VVEGVTEDAQTHLSLILVRPSIVILTQPILRPAPLPISLLRPHSTHLQHCCRMKLTTNLIAPYVMLLINPMMRFISVRGMEVEGDLEESQRREPYGIEYGGTHKWWGWRYGDELRRRVVSVVGGFTCSCIVQCVYVAAAHAHGHGYTHGHGHRTYHRPLHMAFSLQDELILTNGRLMLPEFWIELVDWRDMDVTKEEPRVSRLEFERLIFGRLYAIFVTEELAGHTIHISVLKYVLHEGDSTLFHASEVINLNCLHQLQPGMSKLGQSRLIGSTP